MERKYGLFDDKKFLKQKYEREKLTLVQIAELCNVSRNTIVNRMKKFEIPIRNWKGGYREGRFLHPWKKNKKLCLEQNNYKCVKCGATKKENYNMELDVHHIIPFRCFKNYKDAHNIKNLIALCKKCHFIEESKKSIRETTIGNDCKVWNYVNIYEAEIGRHTNIASFVEIQNGVKIGNDCVIQSHTFIAGNTTIGNNVFIGPGTMICNCKEPRAHNDNWICSPVIIEDNVSIGAGCVILPGVKIGKGSMLGAGAVITKNVGNNEVVVGNPAKVIR